MKWVFQNNLSSARIAPSVTRVSGWSCARQWGPTYSWHGSQLLILFSIFHFYNMYEYNIVILSINFLSPPPPPPRLRTAPDNLTCMNWSDFKLYDLFLYSFQPYNLKRIFRMKVRVWLIYSIRVKRGGSDVTRMDPTFRDLMEEHLSHQGQHRHQSLPWLQPDLELHHLDTATGYDVMRWSERNFRWLRRRHVVEHPSTPSTTWTST